MEVVVVVGEAIRVGVSVCREPTQFLLSGCDGISPCLSVASPLNHTVSCAEYGVSSVTHNVWNYF